MASFTFPDSLNTQIRPRVWIIEDDQDLAETLAEYLGKDHEPTVFREPTEPLSKVQQNPSSVDVIVSDVRMPGMDGLTFAKNLPRGVAGPRFILISGDMDRRELVSAASAGASGYLDKPFAPQELDRLIRIALQECRTERACLSLRERLSQENRLLKNLICELCETRPEELQTLTDHALVLLERTELAKKKMTEKKESLSEILEDQRRL